MAACTKVVFLPLPDAEQLNMTSKLHMCSETLNKLVESSLLLLYAVSRGMKLQVQKYIAAVIDMIDSTSLCGMCSCRFCVLQCMSSSSSKAVFEHTCSICHRLSALTRLQAISACRRWLYFAMPNELILPAASRQALSNDTNECLHPNTL